MARGVNDVPRRQPKGKSPSMDGLVTQGLIFTQHGERLPEMVVIPFPS